MATFPRIAFRSPTNNHLAIARMRKDLEAAGRLVLELPGPGQIPVLLNVSTEQPLISLYGPDSRESDLLLDLLYRQALRSEPDMPGHRLIFAENKLRSVPLIHPGMTTHYLQSEKDLEKALAEIEATEGGFLILDNPLRGARRGWPASAILDSCIAALATLLDPASGNLLIDRADKDCNGLVPLPPDLRFVSVHSINREWLITPLDGEPLTFLLTNTGTGQVQEITPTPQPRQC